MADEGATVAKAFVQVMPSMKDATSNITSAIVPGMEKAGDSAGSKFGTVFSGKAGAVLKAAGGAMAGLFAVSALKDAYETVEAGLNNVKIATGATGEAANELKDVYLEVSKNVSGSFEDIGSAVGELNTRFGLQGDELEAASEQAMKYAKITGQDATSAIQDVAKMMNNAGIPASEYASTLDKLTVAGQAAGIDVAKLAQDVNANATSFKELGFTTDEAIAMLANFDKSGANTSAILAGMKKGVQTWTKEGKSAKDGFAEFVKGVEDGTVTSADAMEIFGGKAGAAMFDAAQKGQLNFDEMYAAITDGSEGALDDIYNDTLTAGEKFDILGKNVQAGVFEILEPLVDALMPYMDEIIEVLKEIVQFTVDVLVPTMQIIVPVITGILDLIKLMPAIIEEGISQATQWFVQFGEDVQNALDTAGGNIQYAFEWIRDTAQNATQNAADFITNIWNGIAGFFGEVVSRIQGAIEGLSNIPGIVGGIFEQAKQAITNPIETARNVIQNILDGIRIVLGAFHIELPRIALPHFNVWGGEFPWGVGGWGAPPEFSVDWYAKGGFSNSATLTDNGNGYGEAGTEFFWPGYEPYFSKYAEKLAEHMPSGNGVDIHDCNFYVRDESDIRKVAQQLNTLINRQNTGAFA